MKNKRKAISIEGKEIDLNKLRRYSGWKGERDIITIFSEDGEEILAQVNVNTLINCWIEKEEEDYLEVTKQKNKKCSN